MRDRHVTSAGEIGHRKVDIDLVIGEVVLNDRHGNRVDVLETQLRRSSLIALIADDKCQKLCIPRLLCFLFDPS